MDKNFSKPLTCNGKSLFYDSKLKDLIIKEKAKCSSNPKGNIREKRLHFAFVKDECIDVYFGNRYLVICSEFYDKKNNDYYQNTDIYDLNDQKFWDVEIKANSDGKTILIGNESYGTHVAGYSDPTSRIGMWREVEEEYVIIPLLKDNKGLEKFIDKKLKENRKDPGNDNLVIGVHGNIVILDLKLIQDIKALYGRIISFTENGQIMRITGKNENEEWINLYYKIIRE